MRKMSLVTTRRDRNLLLVLCLAVVFYVSYTFVINPALAERGRLTMELQSTQDQLAQANEMIAGLSDLKVTERKLREDLTEKYGTFLPALDQAKLLKQLDGYTSGAGLKVTSYIPTVPVPAPVYVEQGVYQPLPYPLLDLAMKVNGELQEPASIPASSDVPVEPATESADMVMGMDVSIGFETSSYESVRRFISSIEGMQKTVLLKNISISDEVDGLQGQLVFTFYALPPLDSQQSSYLNFTPVIPVGKGNPFE